jgi:hypothetical protein
VLVSDVTGNTERFAFLYDERTVESTGLVEKIIFDLDTGTHEGFQLHRMPYCASFKAGRSEFTVATVHIFESDTDFREQEIDLLAEKSYTSVKSSTAKLLIMTSSWLGILASNRKGISPPQKSLVLKLLFSDRRFSLLNPG